MPGIETLIRVPYNLYDFEMNDNLCPIALAALHRLHHDT